MSWPSLIHRPIRALLCSNRGEISARVAATARRLGLRTVAIYTEVDRGCIHVRAADEGVRVPSYLDADAILAAAVRLGVDAIHPGYGFLSESPHFAAAVCRAGLVWVGPPPAAIAAMGSKTAARQRMIAAGVPVVPGVEGEAAEILQSALALHPPLLVKASAGGGGKGMGLVHAHADLPAALAEAARLAQVAFGDASVFVERYLDGARHIEVQVLGDAHGNLTHLWERECSVQRRYQKVIEEAPSPAFVGPAGESARQALCATAVAAARSVGYVGAGTVEFLWEPTEDGGRPWFLEMNTRIQVEHPVTEAITGLDLVEQQIRLAEGAVLDPALSRPPRSGHAIEARLYAEDPARDYLPGAGRLLAWAAPVGEGIRTDAGVEAGSVIGIDYDPMLAKIIATGPDRESARLRLIGALERLVAQGLTTNRAHLIRILRHPAFAAGDLHTRFLAEHALALSESLSEPVADHRDARIAVAAQTLMQLSRARTLLPAIPLGWRNNRWRLPVVRLLDGETEHALPWQQTASGWTIDGADVRLIRDGAPLWLDIDGHTRPWTIQEDGTRRLVSLRAQDLIFRLLPELPDATESESAHSGSVRAPMPGRVVRVAVTLGQAVQKGDALVVIEAMKMEQVLRAPADGVVTSLRAAPGDQVDSGALLLEVEPG